MTSLPSAHRASVRVTPAAPAGGAPDAGLQPSRRCQIRMPEVKTPAWRSCPPMNVITDTGWSGT
ncbi:hypothetical protein ACSNOB_24860 [Micromonospora sp. URMC 106]|uniref:hypothetical protein n=1 Tax=Micromonospora sp. URMC 106 TaxID=3423408 RepID=UPI003F1CD512